MMRSGWVWKEREMYLGKYTLISELVKAGTHRVEIWGNKREGWFPYLVQGTVGVSIGPYFGPETGDTMRDLRNAACRMYGLTPNQVKKGLNFW